MIKTPWARRLGTALWLIAALAILGVASYIAFTNLGHYNDGYDEGVYLESARLMDHGFPLYKSIFDSQAPLWLILVDLGYRLAGESVRSGRLPGAAGFAVTAVGLIWAGRELQGRLAGLLAGGIVLLSPAYLRFARMAEADVPSVALAVVALAAAARYANVGRHRWLVLAALAITASTLTKLLGIYTLPAIGVLILARRGKAPDWRIWIRRAALDLGLVLAIFVAITAAVLLALGPGAVWDQAILYHLAGRDPNHSPWTIQQALAIVSYLHLEPLIVPGLPLAVFVVFARWRGLATLAWAGFNLAGLINQQPLQDHQIVFAIAPLALLIAIGWGQLWSAAVTWVRRSLRARYDRAWIARSATLVFLAAVSLSTVRFERHVRPAWAAERALDAHSEEDAINLRVAPFVLAHSSPSDFILIDQQSVANWLGREVPPGLADTSFVRIDTGYLTANEVIQESTRYHVKVVVFESDRLTKLPQVVAWANRTFPNRVNVGDNRVVYWK